MHTRDQHIHIAYHFGRVLWYLILGVEVLLVIRLGAQVILSVPHAGVALLTDPLVYPVATVLPQALAAQVITFVSMLLYWLVVFGIMKVIARVRPVPETPMEAAMEREQ